MKIAIYENAKWRLYKKNSTTSLFRPSWSSSCTSFFNYYTFVFPNNLHVMSSIIDGNEELCCHECNNKQCLYKHLLIINIYNTSLFDDYISFIGSQFTIYCTMFWNYVFLYKFCIWLSYFLVYMKHRFFLH